MAKTSGILVLAAMALVLAPTAALGDSSSSDWNLGAGGVYSWAGGNTDLTGTNIPTLSVLGDNTSVKNGSSLSIFDGLLNFTSGAFNGTSSTWSWGTGSPGTLNITGCIAGVTAAVCTGFNNVVLVADDFQSVQIVPLGFVIDAVFGNVSGTINQSVAKYFGLPTAFSTGSFATAIATLGTPGQPLVGTNLLGGVIKADPPPVGTPEYWGVVDSIGFLAITLIAFGVMVRWGAMKSHLFQATERS